MNEEYTIPEALEQTWKPRPPQSYPEFAWDALYTAWADIGQRIYTLSYLDPTSEAALNARDKLIQHCETALQRAKEMNRLTSSGCSVDNS